MVERFSSSSSLLVHEQFKKQNLLSVYVYMRGSDYT